MRSAQDTKEALEDLVSSPGWAVFQELALNAFGPASVYADISAVCGASQDLTYVGGAAAARVNVARAIERVLEIPNEYLAAAGGR